MTVQRWFAGQRPYAAMAGMGGERSVRLRWTSPRHGVIPGREVGERHRAFAPELTQGAKGMIEAPSPTVAKLLEVRTGTANGQLRVSQEGRHGQALQIPAQFGSHGT